jgi:uncharacterized protein with PIN domain
MNTLVIDSSALIALYRDEPTADWTLRQLRDADRLLMCTVNLTECLMVFQMRQPSNAMRL